MVGGLKTYILCSREIELELVKSDFPIYSDCIGTYIYSNSSIEDILSDAFTHTRKHVADRCLWIIVTDSSCQGFYIPESEAVIIRQNNALVVHINIGNHPAPIIAGDLVTHITTSLTNLPHIMRCAEMFRYSSINSMRTLELGKYLSHSKDPRHITFSSTYSKFKHKEISNFMGLCGYNLTTAQSLIGISACGPGVTLGMWGESIEEITSMISALKFTDVGYKICNSLRPNEILMSMITCSNNLRFLKA